MSSLCDKITETGMLMKIISATIAFGNTQKFYCSNSKELFTSVDNYITVFRIHVPDLWHLNFPKVCCKGPASKWLRYLFSQISLNSS